MTADHVTRLAKHTVLGATFALIIFLVIIHLGRASFNLLILLAQLLPLALTLPGLLQGKSRAMQWLCFVVMFFLVQGILLAFSPGSLLAGLLETGICLVLFFSAIIFIRGSRRSSQPVEQQSAESPLTDE